VIAGSIITSRRSVVSGSSIATRPVSSKTVATQIVFKPDIALSDKPSEFVKRQVFFTFEVEEEGGFRRVPEIGLKNFL